MTSADLSQASMHDLFRMEAENQSQVLTAALLALENNPTAADHLESCMRAAHSLKGAARIVDIDAGVTLAHAMEDFFVAAQQRSVTLDQQQIDLMLRGVDLMMSIAKTADLGEQTELGGATIDLFVGELGQILRGQDKPRPAETEALPVSPAPPMARERADPGVLEVTTDREAADRLLRVTAENLSRLLGLAGESLVESRWLKPFGESLLRLKRMHYASAKAVGSLREALPQHALDERAQTALTDVRRQVRDCQEFLSARLAELEAADRQTTRLAQRLYDQAVACRMRPFADGVLRYPRMIRDIARSLGKQARLDIIGTATQVDRDLLEKLDAPLGHLLRNAVDHGIETSDERRSAGKPPEGLLCLEARHSAGALWITASDDGRGIDLEKLRETVVQRRLANPEIASELGQNELLDFLFLPGFTMKNEVTEISGRGVGLDVVHDMIKQVRGVVRISSQLGRGTRFQLQLPLTLSVIPTLLVDIGGESYAFPLAHIVRATKLPVDEIKILEGRQYFNLDGQQIGLVSGHQLLEDGEPNFAGDELAVVVVGDQNNRYGLLVDRFLGARELVVRPFDPRLGKIEDVSAAAIMENGSPTLIVDVEDMIRSMEKLARSDRLDNVQRAAAGEGQRPRKAVLVVDDSLTVREVQRKLLDRHGYESEVAVDGMDGWNAVRACRFDLIVTDVDMPRMDGIELVTRIKADPNLKSLPVMILSYKDREEDRRRGLEAGADYYIAKGSFHDDTWIKAVRDLIGTPEA